MSTTLLFSTYLRCTSNGSNKVYHIEAYPDRVETSYGPYGRNLRTIVIPLSKCKGKDPVQEAEKIERAKLKKNYFPYQQMNGKKASKPVKTKPKSARTTNQVGLPDVVDTGWGRGFSF